MDIAMTDIPRASASLLPAVADHRGVLTTIPFEMPKVIVHERQVWHYRDADWDRLKEELRHEEEWGHLRRWHRTREHTSWPR